MFTVFWERLRDKMKAALDAAPSENSIVGGLVKRLIEKMRGPPNQRVSAGLAAVFGPVPKTRNEARDAGPLYELVKTVKELMEWTTQCLDDFNQDLQWKDQVLDAVELQQLLPELREATLVTRYDIQRRRAVSSAGDEFVSTDLCFRDAMSFVLFSNANGWRSTQKSMYDSRTCRRSRRWCPTPRPIHSCSCRSVPLGMRVWAWRTHGPILQRATTRNVPNQVETDELNGCDLLVVFTYCVADEQRV